MFNLASYAALALSTVSAVSGLVVPRSDSPAGWATNDLEPWTVYYTRYLALGCNRRSGEPFFDQCCHPLLTTQALETARPPQCIPSTPSFSQAPAPQPTTSQAPAPQPTTTQAPQPTSEAPASKPSTPLAARALVTGGVATSYKQNGNFGACGAIHRDDELIAAVEKGRYGNIRARSTLCGKKVKITNTANKKSVTAIIVDACSTCQKNSFDLSPGAFQKIAAPGQGRANIEWSLV
ncbi:RlpA-like double-psi beta-barrel-protein domain-containing protein-containing protein [Infundibulicybe gibba]|nr:RlpA-like double-psi beta-barrel-protein domain-containing protein-containing protein [Infundibulicybe gibba]